MKTSDATTSGSLQPLPRAQRAPKSSFVKAATAPLRKNTSSLTRRVRDPKAFLRSSIITKTDSYKWSHFKQYPPKTTFVFSYFESRKGAKFDETVFFGLQQLLKDHFTGIRVTKKDIEQADHISKAHFGNADNFNRAGWEHILKKHGGKLPLSIKAVPEGSAVPTSNVLMTVQNTDPEAYWLTNFVEGLLTHVWYGSTVATQSREMKKTILAYLHETSDGGEKTLPFKLHDFGFRGVSSLEQAGVGGAAHLLNFKGTDNMAGIAFSRQYYGAEMPGHSVPAAEHSTITSWTREGEEDAYRNMLTQYPTGLVSIVSDSYDIFNACSNLFGDKLKDQIMRRDGVLVVRPDSGVPKDMVLKTHEMLGEKFGTTVNSKGFKVLNPKVAILQGDGIDVGSIHGILSTLKEHGWSTEALALGSGGGLLQKVNRDTQKFAFKASSAVVDGKQVDIFKDPITDPGKVSKTGRLKLVMENGQFRTVAEDAPGKNMLREIFRNGKLLVDDNFETIRERAKLQDEPAA